MSKPSSLDALILRKQAQDWFHSLCLWNCVSVLGSVFQGSHNASQIPGCLNRGKLTDCKSLNSEKKHFKLNLKFSVFKMQILLNFHCIQYKFNFMKSVSLNAFSSVVASQFEDHLAFGTTIKFGHLSKLLGMFILLHM